ncbi:MAG: hypothetical protein ACYTFG_19200, partial [Planctomycetota bacterium]
MNLAVVAIPYREGLSSSDYGLDDPGTWGSRNNAFAAALAAPGIGWTVAQTGYYNESTSFFVLEHTSGAQIMGLSAFYNNLQHINAANDDEGTAANSATLRIAFGSSGLTTQLPSITDSFNPYDSATFCADYGLHKFRR